MRSCRPCRLDRKQSRKGGCVRWGGVAGITLAFFDIRSFSPLAGQRVPGNIWFPQSLHVDPDCRSPYSFGVRLSGLILYQNLAIQVLFPRIAFKERPVVLTTHVNHWVKSWHQNVQKADDLPNCLTVPYRVIAV